MIDNIAMLVYEMENMNIKWLPEIFVEKYCEKEKLWASSPQHAYYRSIHTSTRSIKERREDVNDFEGPSQHEVNKLRTLGKKI
jgi:hypothetical protein